MPRHYRRAMISAAGLLLGAMLGTLYVYLLLHFRGTVPYVQAAVIGAACGLILVTIPGLIWAFVRKQWYRIQLRQWTDKALVLANAARHELQEETVEQTPALHNDLGVIDFLQRRFPEAAAGFEQAATEDVAEAEANLLAALAETGRWDELKLKLERLGRGDTQLAETNLARIGARVPDLEVVERLWQTAQEGRQPLLLNNLGVRAMQGNRPQQAERAFGLALEQKPAYPYAHANLGVLAFRQGDLRKAVAETASAAGLVAEDEVVFANLGGLLSLAGDARTAEKWLERAHRLEPHNAGALINLGLAHHLAGRGEEALTALQSAQRLPEAAATANYDLAFVHHAQGNEPEAIEHLQATLAEAEDDADALNNLGCVLFAQGQYQAAFEHFERVAKLSRAGVYRRNVIRAELAAGRLDEAEELLDDLTGDDSVSLERGLVHLLRATRMKAETETHRQMLDFNLSAATSAFTKAIALGQSATEARYNYGLAQYLHGEYRAAAETFAQSLKKPNGHPEMYYAAAMSFIFAGMREAVEHESSDGKLAGPVRELYLKARPYLEKASEVTSIAEVAIYDLGLLNYLLGDYQRGIEVLRKIVRSDSPPHLLNALAITQARLAQELQLTAQTATLLPDTKKRDIRQQAVKLLGSAVYYFKQALEVAPEASLSHANLGLALMLRNQRGDVEAALNHWQLMHQHGDARARKTFEQFMQAQSPDAAQRLRFQDVELVFRPLAVNGWVVLVPPTMSAPRYVIAELLDVPEWRLQGQHRLVQRALKYRAKAERVRRKLHRLAI